MTKVLIYEKTLIIVQWEIHLRRNLLHELIENIHACDQMNDLGYPCSIKQLRAVVDAEVVKNLEIFKFLRLYSTEQLIEGKANRFKLPPLDQAADKNVQYQFERNGLIWLTHIKHGVAIWPHLRKKLNFNTKEHKMPETDLEQMLRKLEDLGYDWTFSNFSGYSVVLIKRGVNYGNGVALPEFKSTYNMVDAVLKALVWANMMENKNGKSTYR